MLKDKDDRIKINRNFQFDERNKMTMQFRTAYSQALEQKIIFVYIPLLYLIQLLNNTRNI